MSYWTDWEFTERELMEIANETIFRDRPDLQFKFDGSAPPLIAPIEAFGRDGETRLDGEATKAGSAPNNTASLDRQGK